MKRVSGMTAKQVSMARAKYHNLKGPERVLTAKKKKKLAQVDVDVQGKKSRYAKAQLNRKLSGPQGLRPSRKLDKHGLYGPR